MCVYNPQDPLGMVAHGASQGFQGSTVEEGATSDAVLDVSVNDRGSWLIIITTAMGRVYHCSSLSSTEGSDGAKQERWMEVLAQRSHGSAEESHKLFDTSINSHESVVSTPVGWEMVTVMKNTDEDGMMLSAAWAPSLLYSTALVVCTYHGVVSLRRLVMDSPETAAFPYESDVPYFEEVYRAVITPPPALCVAWAPAEFGRIFAAGGSVDCGITIFTGADGVWIKEMLHPPVISTTTTVAPSQTPSPLRITSGCTSLSFGPFLPSSALLTAPLLQDVEVPCSLAGVGSLKLVSCDRGKYVWLWERQLQQSEVDNEDGDGRCAPSSPSTHHNISSNSNSSCINGGNCSFGWVLKGALPLSSPLCPLSYPPPCGDSTSMSFDRDPSWREVSWAKSEGLPFHYVAAGAEEGFVGIWEHDEEEWKLVLADQSFSSHGAVTRLSWSEVGTFLLVSYADGHIIMWKETSNAGWKVASEIDNER